MGYDRSQSPDEDHLWRNADLRRSQSSGLLRGLCSHSIQMSADRWPDNVRLSDIEPLFVCQACGNRGADVRGLFAPARMGTG
jgi:hypothetical protein